MKHKDKFLATRKLKKQSFNNILLEMYKNYRNLQNVTTNKTKDQYFLKQICDMKDNTRII